MIMMVLGGMSAAKVPATARVPPFYHFFQRRYDLAVPPAQRNKCKGPSAQCSVPRSRRVLVFYS